MARSYHTFHETVKNLRPLSLLRTEVLFAEPWGFTGGHILTRLANSSSNDGDSECGCRRSCWKLYFECCALPRLAGDVDGTPVLADNVEGAKKPHGGFDARPLRVDSRVKELLE